MLEFTLRTVESNRLARAFGVDRQLILSVNQACGVEYYGGTGDSACPAEFADAPAAVPPPEAAPVAAVVVAPAAPVEAPAAAAVTYRDKVGVDGGRVFAAKGRPRSIIREAVKAKIGAIRDIGGN